MNLAFNEKLYLNTIIKPDLKKLVEDKSRSKQSQVFIFHKRLLTSSLLAGKYPCDEFRAGRILYSTELFTLTLSSPAFLGEEGMMRLVPVT